MRIELDLLLGYPNSCMQIAEEIETIADSLANHTVTSQHLCNHIYDAFFWKAFAFEHPDMTAEEIASAAADGFAVEV